MNSSQIEINKKLEEYENRLKSNLPSYAFAYEEGDRYVRTSFMVEIERQMKDYKIGLLEEALKSKN